MKREYIYISRLFIAYGVIGHFAARQLVPLCPFLRMSTNIILYTLFIIFYICFYKEYILKPLKNKAFLSILSVLRNKPKIDILNVKS